MSGIVEGIERQEAKSASHFPKKSGQQMARGTSEGAT